eukprot:TRINITY_DN10798_c0_g1_i1.p1 TRINITY_DN10798_c0_g1~~TRINITY_DN10798_c0_g1_i1.p1  ORF type:complete len:143 (+),score=6.17 TRINITY_DN10798_c0_g1_i1:22-429(+)
MATLVYTQRCRQSAAFLVLQLTNELLNLGLKKIVNQPRPHGANQSDNGMPSSHTQFMFFFFTIFFMQFMEKRRLGHIEAMASFVAALIVGFSRFYLGYHSLDQVFVGAVAGVISGCVMVTFFPMVERLLRVFFLF